MGEQAQVPITGCTPVIDFYGYWPTFHDAELVNLSIDDRMRMIVGTFTLNDMAGEDGPSRLATITLLWKGVEQFSFAADYSDATENWLWHLRIVKSDDWIDTTLAANDGIGGTIRARHIEVTQFEPIAE